MNNFKGLYAVFMVTALLEVTTTAADDMVNVTVLYESLCPDSMRFIRKQLYPTYSELEEYMNVELVPFGKADYSMNPWRITCQHGPRECLGNALQACAINRFPTNEMQVKFVHCVMSDNYPPGVGAQCAQKLNYSYDGVEECARNEEGRRLMAYHGDRTNTFRKILTFVPTIIFNNKFDDNMQRRALRNLKSAVCSFMTDPKPNACAES